MCCSAKTRFAQLTPSQPRPSRSLLRWPAEVRSLDELELGSDVIRPTLGKGELDMAKRLVEDMSADWQPDDYRDSFQDKIMALVAKKAKAGKIEDVETTKGSDERKSADVIDLTELLKRSLAGKPATKKTTTKKSNKKAS